MYINPSLYSHFDLVNMHIGDRISAHSMGMNSKLASLVDLPS